MAMAMPLKMVIIQLNMQVVQEGFFFIYVKTNVSKFEHVCRSPQVPVGKTPGKRGAH